MFGSRIIAKNPGSRSAKLDDHTSGGIFLHHTSTTSISKCIDEKTGREKVTSHITFDEADFSCTRKPLGSTTLINSGIKAKNGDTTHDCAVMEMEQIPDDNLTDSLIVKRLSDKAIVPTRTKEGSAGHDLFSTQQVTVQPNEIILIPTDIAIMCPKQTYGRIVPCQGLTVQRKLVIRDGIIDSDYNGNIQVAMQDIDNVPQRIHAGDNIAQLMIERTSETHAAESNLDMTVRNKEDLRSIDEVKTTVSDNIPHLISHDADEIEPAIHSAITKPKDLILSACPFGPTIEMEIGTNSTHPTLGMEIDERNMKGRLKLMNCAKSTPAHRMKR